MDIVGRLKQIKEMDNAVNLLSVLRKGGEYSKFTIEVHYRDIVVTVATINNSDLGYVISTPKNKFFKVYTGKRDLDTLSRYLIADCIKVNAQAMYEPTMTQLKFNMKECKKNA